MLKISCHNDNAYTAMLSLDMIVIAMMTIMNCINDGNVIMMLI